MRTAPLLTESKHKTVKAITCPFCKATCLGEDMFVKHLIHSHAELIDNVLELRKSTDDFGYLMSCLEAKLDNYKTELWMNS